MMTEKLDMKKLGQEVAAAMGDGWHIKESESYDYGVVIAKGNYQIWLHDNRDGRIEIRESIERQYHNYRSDWKPTKPGQPSERYGNVTCMAKADKGAAKIAKDILTKVVPQTIERTDDAIKRWTENNDQKGRVKVLSEEIGKLHPNMRVEFENDTGLTFTAYPYNKRQYERVAVGNGLQYEIKSSYERIEAKIEGLDLEQTKKLLAFLDTL